MARRPSPEAIARAPRVPAEALRAWLRVDTPGSPEEYREAFDTVSGHLPEDLREEWEKSRQEFGGLAAAAFESPTSWFRSRGDEAPVACLAALSARDPWKAPTLPELLRDPKTREQLMDELAAELRSGDSRLMEAIIHRAAEGDIGVGEALLRSASLGGRVQRGRAG